MTDLHVLLNRYDGHPLIGMIHANSVQNVGGDLLIALPLVEDGEFEIYFDGAVLPIEEAQLERARSLMACIGELDNNVQLDCAEACRRTGIHPRNFESVLAYVKLSSGSTLLHYFGASVNTEWDEVVELSSGRWRYMGTAGQVAKSSGA
ncbi:MAG: hypothetical protein QM719_02065 [Thermomonas sp.]